MLIDLCELWTNINTMNYMNQADHSQETTEQEVSLVPAIQLVSINRNMP